MARFCGNCGSQVDDDAKVCGQCGKPLNLQNNNRVGQNLEKTDTIKKLVKWAVALIAIIAIIIVSINTISQFTGVRGVARKVIIAINNYDIDKLTSLSSNIFFYNEDKDAYAVDQYENYLKNISASILNEFDDSVGADYKFSYKMEEISKPREYKREEIIENLEDDYPNFDINSIKQFTEVKVTLTAKKGKKALTQRLTFLMSKEDGKWKLLSIED